MGHKRKATDHSAGVPSKRFRPSNSKSGIKGKYKWRETEKSVKKFQTVKSIRKGKMETGAVATSSDTAVNKVVTKHKRKRTTSGSGSHPNDGISTESKTAQEKLPGTKSTVIAKHKQRVKKRKKIPENQRTPVKATSTGVEGKVAAKPRSVLTEKEVVAQCSGGERLHLPQTADEVSSNWKKLQMTLKPAAPRTQEPGAKPKRKGPPQFVKERAKLKEKAKEEKTKEPDIWFDDVDDILIDSLRTKALIDEHMKDESSSSTPRDPLVKPDSYKGITKIVAMDCEMVGVGEEGKDSILARVSIVNQYGQCIYDKFVQAQDDVTDYRTHVSGVRPEDMEKGEEFATVQKEVHHIMKGRMLVGHALHNDLKVLFLDHPRKKIRDTARYKPFRKLFGGTNPSLKKLVDKVLGVKVQEGEHSSVQDAQAAMRLYTMYRKQWEKDLKTKIKGKPNALTTRTKTEATSTVKPV